jgi:energy-coupling factor transporter ATP-binding protein EcfA2
MLDLLNEVSNETSNLLFLALLGPSGAGKSHLAGTAPGKILYVHGSAESHGVASARKSGGNVLPVCFDRDKSGALKPDQAYKRLLEILRPEVIKKAEVTSIVFDGLTELEKLVRETDEFKNRCATKNGGHDKFSEQPSTISMMDKVFNALRDAQYANNAHIIVLGILDVQKEDEKTGAIELAAPRLSGYGVAVTAIQQFGDILAIGKMRNAKGETGWAIQTGSTVSKVSRAAEKDGGHVKKFINFDCRLQLPAGVDLPAFIKADLKDVIALKTGK